VKEITVAEIIEKIKFLKNLKTDKEIASLLGITPNALNNFKRRNSIGAFFEKIIYTALNLDSSISLDYLVHSTNQSINLDKIFNEAKSIAVILNQEDDLQENLIQYINDKKPLSVVINKIKNIKAKNLFPRLMEAWHGEGERMLIVLYYFIEHLEKQNIDKIQDIKNNFIEALEKFSIPNINNFHKFIINEKDKHNLIKWADENLDDISCFEIIQLLPSLKTSIKDELNFINKLTV